MDLKKLHSTFYTDNPVLIQALDFDMELQAWRGGEKVRGHGIVQVDVNGLTFAIPVRSNISHDASLILEVSRGDPRVKGMGLDYSKALLITKASHVSGENFVLRSKPAGKKLLGKQAHIQKQFQRYIQKYIAAVTKNDTQILSSKEYRFTTLVNYHDNLGLNPPI